MLPVGLFGEQRKMSLVCSLAAARMPFLSMLNCSPSSGIVLTSMPWISAYTRYISNVGGVVMMLSRYARHQARISTSIASLLPRVTSRLSRGTFSKADIFALTDAGRTSG